jgi:hypothetical protein
MPGLGNLIIGYNEDPIKSLPGDLPIMMAPGFPSPLKTGDRRGSNNYTPGSSGRKHLQPFCSANQATWPEQQGMPNAGLYAQPNSSCTIEFDRFNFTEMTVNVECDGTTADFTIFNR